MKLSLFLFILVLFLVYSTMAKRRLHLFEVLFIWMTIWLITHSISSIFITNLEFISLSQRSDLFWLHVLKRLILYPLIIIHFISIYLCLKKRWTKISLFVVNILLMSSLEFFFIAIGVLQNNQHQYKLWMSLMEWTFTLTVTYVSWLWYRKRYM
jgi:hypothetical protein